MASDKNKIVENYVLEELRCINPDQSEIWTAKHRILKKNFTLKRVKYPSSQTDLPLGGVSGSGRDEWCYQNILRETNILKRLICETAPRCHKMIKTNNNLYVVYDEFPHNSLADHLAAHRPSRTQKMSLMQTVSKALAGVHAKTVVLLNLSAGNIFLREKNNVLFGDWSMARETRMGQKEEKVDCSYLVGTHACFAKEVIEGGKWSYWSDVYSLGCLFRKIHKSGFLQEPQSADKQLQKLIARMLSERPEERPKLDVILKALQFLGGEEGPELVDSPRSSDKGFSSTRAIGGLRIKHGTSTPTEFELHDCSFSPKKELALLETPKMSKEDCPSINGSKSVKSANSDQKTTDMHTAPSSKLQHKKSFDLGTPLSSYSRGRRVEEKAPSMDVIKLVGKKRNQAFFLLELSEFVLKMWVCPELGYMLLKYALLTLTSAGEQWQRQRQGNLSQKERDDVTAIITSQKCAISSALNKLKRHLYSSLTNPGARKELQLDSQISERFLKQKILQFGKQMVLYCEQSLSDKASQSKLVDSLFKTYMILKKIEENSYQKFWDKIYNGEYAFLHSQKYLRDEKQLGHRYLQSRIAEILRGK